MIKSMTGYGKAEAILGTGKLTIEIRSLNGKNADINLKTSIIPKDKEIGLRKKLEASLQRGTIDFFVTWEEGAAESAGKVNADLVKEYYRQIVEIREGCGMACDGHDDNILLASILRFPDVLQSKKTDVITEENWPVVENAIDQTIAALNEFRAKEGAALYKDVVSGVGFILDQYPDIERFETERVENVRARILRNLEELRQKPDKERFEQEMIYYLEKLDINEEKVRLRQHCRYFMDTIDTDPAPGKKLGFIIQEMGREINTMGSKANHAGLQKTVVGMKEKLEKIREQTMNIL